MYIFLLAGGYIHSCRLYHLLTSLLLLLLHRANLSMTSAPRITTSVNVNPAKSACTISSIDDQKLSLPESSSITAVVAVSSSVTSPYLYTGDKWRS